MKRKFLCLCLALVIVLGGLTGCKDKKEEETTTTTVATSTTTTEEASSEPTKKGETKKTTKKTTTTTKKTEKKSEAKKTYTCPDGYKLDGTKCTITKDATATCPDGTKIDGELCVKISDYNTGTRKCNSMYIEGHDYPGEYYQPSGGPATCAYAPINYYTDRDSCVNAAPSNPYGWYNGKCYKKVITGNPSYTTTCTGDYKYYSSADILSKFGGHNNGGCYKTSKVTYKCEDGFTLKDKKCTKTVEATLK